MQQGVIEAFGAMQRPELAAIEVFLSVVCRADGRHGDASREIR